MKSMGKANLWIMALIVTIVTPVFAQCGETPAASPLTLTDSQSQYPLGLHPEILEDPTGQLTIAAVSPPERLAKSLQLNELTDWLEQLVMEAPRAA